MQIITSDPEKVILSAIKKYTNYLSPTYGPAGKGVLIDNGLGTKIIDDGKIATDDFEIEDELENAVVKYIKEVTSKTDKRAGDGTTTAALVMANIVEQVLEEKGEFEDKKNIHAEVVSLKKGLVEAIEKIKKESKKIKTKEELYSVAFNSFNNEEIAKLISTTLEKIGVNGAILVEDSKGMDTTCELVDGMEIEKGFVSPYLINNPRGEVVLKNPAVLLVEGKVDFFKEIAPAIKKLIDNSIKDFVVVAEGFSDSVINEMIFHKIQGTFKPLLVESEGFGENKTENLIDLAILTGATVVDKKKDFNFDKVEMEHFGTVGTVTATRNSTLFTEGKGSKTDIKKRVEGIKKMNEGANEYEKQYNEKRIARLSGGIALLKVGALTEGEQKTIRAKTEDAVNATKLALLSGVVKGGGKTLDSIETSSETLNNALKFPRKVLEDNGKEFLDKNVTDPSAVLIASIETAVSTACNLLETGSISAKEREKKEDDKNKLNF